MKRNEKGQFVKTVGKPTCKLCGKKRTPNKGKMCRPCYLESPFGKEHYRRISENHKKIGVGKWMKGRKIPPETIAKRVAKMKGRKRPPFSAEWRRKIGLAGKGRRPTPEAKKNHHDAIMKFIQTPAYRQKQRLAHVGKKSANWRGGITPLRIIIRESKKYEHWRKSIYERDNYTCVLCKKYGGVMHVDHFPITFSSILRIYKISTLLEAVACNKLWDMNNGRVLCLDCHRNTETWGYTKRNYDAI